jgi:ComF family protein
MAPWRSVSPEKPTLPPEPVVRTIVRRAIDLMLPPRCAACDNPVAGQGQLCSDCFGRTNFITAPICSRCGVPFASVEQGGADAQCPGCRERPPGFRQARAALRYDEQARRLILPLKHGDRLELAAILAPMMVRAGSALLRRADVLVPVPLHRRRLFQRTYNQAAVLAFAVGRLAERPVSPDMLIRTRRTEPLDDKSPEERAREVAGAMAVRPSRRERLVGRVVLLIDDVMTSGATANACAAAMSDAGALAVDVLVAARVPDPRLN